MRERASPLVATLLAPLLVAACGVNLGPRGLFNGLVGTWDWVEATGGIASMTITPTSTGETLELTFTSMAELEVVRNDSLEQVVDFSVGPVLGGQFPDRSLEITYHEQVFGFDTQVATFPNDSTLVLTDPCCDGFAYTFVRVP